MAALVCRNSYLICFMCFTYPYNPYVVVSTAKRIFNRLWSKANEQVQRDNLSFVDKNFDFHTYRVLLENYDYFTSEDESEDMGDI